MVDRWLTKRNFVATNWFGACREIFFRATIDELWETLEEIMKWVWWFCDIRKGKEKLKKIKKTLKPWIVV